MRGPIRATQQSPISDRTRHCCIVCYMNVISKFINFIGNYYELSWKHRQTILTLDKLQVFLYKSSIHYCSLNVLQATGISIQVLHRLLQTTCITYWYLYVNSLSIIIEQVHHRLCHSSFFTEYNYCFRSFGIQNLLK